MPSQDQVTPPPTPAVAFSDRDNPGPYDESDRATEVDDETRADPVADTDEVPDSDVPDADNVPGTETNTETEDVPGTDTDTETAPVAAASTTLYPVAEPSTADSETVGPDDDPALIDNEQPTGDGPTDDVPTYDAAPADDAVPTYGAVPTDDAAPAYGAVPVDDGAGTDEAVPADDAPAVESATYQGSSYQHTGVETVADVDAVGSDDPVDDESDDSLTRQRSADPVLVDRTAAEPLADPDSSDSSTAAGVAYIPPQPGSIDSNGTEASDPDDGLAASDVETVPSAAVLAEEPALGERRKATSADSIGEPVAAEVDDSTETPADAPVVVPVGDAPVEDADVPVEDGDAVELSPGDVALTPVAALWPDDAAEALRQRWRDLQLRFVDDPSNAAAEADFLVGEAIETLTGSLASLRTDLSSWRSEGAGDTERLRVAVQRYREFLDRILGL